MNRLEIQKQYVTGVTVAERELKALDGFKPWGVVTIFLRGNPDNPFDKMELAMFVDGNAAGAARELARQLTEAADITDLQSKLKKAEHGKADAMLIAEYGRRTLG